MTQWKHAAARAACVLPAATCGEGMGVGAQSTLQSLRDAVPPHP